jgi:hypothetical protein
MSSLSISNAQRIEVIKNFGYNEREAAFLCWAALHGGYFLRRQYAFFLGKDSSGAVAALVDKLTDQEHARTLTALNNTKIHHLSSRPFYTAIGEPDNRNRREHAPAAIKIRLMGLDFALAHREHHYLATEREKLDYFNGALGIPLSDLPWKRYVSRKSRSTTTRYFVDKYPIFLKESRDGEAGATVSFCFIDPGSTTLSSFETSLQQYASLWRHLKAFEVVCVADIVRWQAQAERRFKAFLGRSGGTTCATETPLSKRLTEHFEARLLYEKGDLSSFSREKLIRLRNETVEFSTPQYQELYGQWKVGKAPAMKANTAPNHRPGDLLNARFSTYLINHDYRFFGAIGSRGELSGGANGPTPRTAQGVGAVFGTSLETRTT